VDPNRQRKPLGDQVLRDAVAHQSKADETDAGGSSVHDAMLMSFFLRKAGGEPDW
jgi:hypothetical protein